MKKVIAITIGDPSGIGPEIIAKALYQNNFYKECVPVVIGNADVMREGIRVAGVPMNVESISSLRDVVIDASVMNVFEVYPGYDIKGLQYGKIQKESGVLAYKSIEAAIRLAISQEVSAVVTAPIHKESFALAGSPYPGHTEMFAAMTGTQDFSMILMYNALRVAHVTTHVSMQDAVRLIKTPRILKTIQVAHNACIQLGIPHPVIAVAGLNPHAGEGGMFGKEEIDEIIPAIEKANSAGIHTVGPIPADTLFSKAVAGMYDCVVAMYHDQGHIPIKLLGFALNGENGVWSDIKGVNITFGLPIIRVSVDHGTAFGKAGKGTANPSSLIEAISIALKISGNDTIQS